MFDFDLPEQGLYRTRRPMPGNETMFPSPVLVFIGDSKTPGAKFIVRPSNNRRNRWFWAEPALALKPTDAHWARSLLRLPVEGFYTLPETIHLDGGGKWLKNAIVELGYNERGQGIVFLAEWDENGEENVLTFSDHGVLVDDTMLMRLIWAPILPIRSKTLPPPPVLG